MALDPSIILQGRPAPNALDSQGRVLKLRQLQMANDEAERGIADRQTVANLYRNNIDASGNLNAAGITQGLAQAGMGDQIPEFQTGQAKYGHAVAQMNAQQVEFHKKQLDAVNGSLASLLAKPDVTHQDVIAQISSLVDNGIIDNAAGAAMVKQLPGPDQLRPFLLQKAVEGLDQSKRLEMVLPKYNEQDRGDVINQGTVNLLTGERTAGANVKKGVNPSAAVMGGGGMRGKPPSGYQWDSSGNLSPITGGPADLNARPKNLRPVPPAIAGGLISNRQEIGKVDRALQALDANPDAFGAQNYLPDALTQRFDSPGMKGGVDARAKVADISSMIIHDRSGAAVSASEFPRLAPFIPQKTDDPATVKIKLQNLKATLEAMNEEVEGSYTEDAGYRPIGTASTATAAPNAAPIAVPPDIAAILAKHGSK